MSCRRLTLAASLIAALAASAATGAATKPVSHHARGHARPAVSVSRLVRAGTPGAIFAPFPSTAVRTPFYVYEPAATPSAPAEPTCFASGENCTPVDLCQDWGENC